MSKLTKQVIIGTIAKSALSVDQKNAVIVMPENYSEDDFYNKAQELFNVQLDADQRAARRSAIKSDLMRLKTGRTVYASQIESGEGEDKKVIHISECWLGEINQPIRDKIAEWKQESITGQQIMDIILDLFTKKVIKDKKRADYWNDTIISAALSDFITLDGYTGLDVQQIFKSSNARGRKGGSPNIYNFDL